MNNPGKRIQTEFRTAMAVIIICLYLAAARTRYKFTYPHLTETQVLMNLPDWIVFGSNPKS